MLQRVFGKNAPQIVGEPVDTRLPEKRELDTKRLEIDNLLANMKRRVALDDKLYKAQTDIARIARGKMGRDLAMGQPIVKQEYQMEKLRKSRADASKVLQKASRGMLARKQARELRETPVKAQTKIASTVRGKKGRETAKQVKSEKVRTEFDDLMDRIEKEERQREYDETLDILKDIDKSNAQTKIASAVRGMQTRKSLDDAEKRAIERKAQTKISSLFRGRKARQIADEKRLFDRDYDAEDKAQTKIASLLRGVKGRQEAKKAKVIADEKQKEFEETMDVLKDIDRDNAQRTIARIARGKMGRDLAMGQPIVKQEYQMEKLRKERSDASKKLQKATRDMIERNKKNKAQITIASALRGRKVRATTVKDARDDLERENETKKIEQAQTKIASALRGKLSREKLAEAKNAQTKIASLLRGTKGRKTATEVKKDKILSDAFDEAVEEHEKLLDKIEELEAQAEDRSVDEELKQRRLRRSATVIQKRIRGMQSRGKDRELDELFEDVRRGKEQSKAQIKIASLFRGKMGRAKAKQAMSEIEINKKLNELIQDIKDIKNKNINKDNKIEQISQTLNAYNNYFKTVAPSVAVAPSEADASEADTTIDFADLKTKVQNAIDDLEDYMDLDEYKKIKKKIETINKTVDITRDALNFIDNEDIVDAIPELFELATVYQTFKNSSKTNHLKRIRQKLNIFG